MRQMSGTYRTVDGQSNSRIQGHPQTAPCPESSSLPALSTLREKEIALSPARMKAAWAILAARGIERAEQTCWILRCTSGNTLAKRRAALFAARLLPVIAQIRESGAVTSEEVAVALNERSISTATGSAWSAPIVRKFLRRAKRMDPLR